MAAFGTLKINSDEKKMTDFVVAEKQWDNRIEDLTWTDLTPNVLYGRRVSCSLHTLLGPRLEQRAYSKARGSVLFTRNPLVLGAAESNTRIFYPSEYKSGTK